MISEEKYRDCEEASTLSSQASSRGNGFPHQQSKPKAAEMGLDKDYVVILFPFPTLIMWLTLLAVHLREP